jgi:hypothetical protein
MLLWGLAQQAPHCKLSQAQLQQITAAFVKSVKHTPGMHAVAVSGVLSAVAKMEQQLPSSQLQQLLQLASKWQNNMSAQALSNVLWAAAKLSTNSVSLQQQQQQQQQRWQQQQRQQRPLLLSLSESLANFLADVSPQGVSLALWACSELLLFPALLLQALGTGLGSDNAAQLQQQQQQQWDRLLPGMSLQAAANVALALARLGHADVALMTKLTQHALSLVDQQQHAAQCGSSSSNQIHITNSRENYSYSESSSSSSSSSLAQAVCNICWAAAVLDLHELAGNVRRLAAAAACMKVAWGSINQQGLLQLQQVHVWLQDCQHDQGLGVATADYPSQGLAAVLTRQQLQQCSDAAAALQRQAAAAVTSVSDTQRAVFETLRQLPLFWQQQPQMEQLAEPDGAAVIDIAGVLWCEQQYYTGLQHAAGAYASARAARQQSAGSTRGR